MNIHRHGLVLDGVYCTGGDGAPVFHQAPAPTNDQPQRLLDKIINRIMKLLTHLDPLIEEEGITYMAGTDSIDPEHVLTLLSVSTYRIAMGSRAVSRSERVAVPTIRRRNIVNVSEPLRVPTDAPTPAALRQSRS